MTRNVLHVLGSAQPETTGIVRIVCALAESLDPGKYCFHALFLAGGGPLVDMLRKAGVQASATQWRQGVRDPVGAWNFWRRLRQQKFAIVHLHFGGRSVCWLARAATHAKIIRQLHTRILEPQGLTPVTLSARGADAVVAVSKAVASRVVGGTARVIYSGLSFPDGDPPSAHATSEIVIGTAGRLVALKGIECLIDAAAALYREFPTLRVEIAGTGPHQEKLREAVARAGLEEQVKFLGWLDDLPSRLSRWDVFVMPSLEEGFPIAALEAMAAGLPIVASSVGGLPELVDDGISGWLIPAGDVEALTSRLRLLLSNQEQRLMMGAAGYARARHNFSLARMTQSFASLYDELLSEGGS